MHLSGVEHLQNLIEQQTEFTAKMVFNASGAVIFPCHATTSRRKSSGHFL